MAAAAPAVDVDIPLVVDDDCLWRKPKGSTWNEVSCTLTPGRVRNSGKLCRLNLKQVGMIWNPTWRMKFIGTGSWLETTGSWLETTGSHCSRGPVAIDQWPMVLTGLNFQRENDGVVPRENDREVIDLTGEEEGDESDLDENPYKRRRIEPSQGSAPKQLVFFNTTCLLKPP